MDNFPELGVYSFNSDTFQGIASEYSQQVAIEKAYTTGSGIVQPGDTTPANFRTQFLSETLEQVSFSQDDAGFMKDIAKEKIGSVTAEWSASISYGGAGDNFVAETGSDGLFNVSGADDQFLRQIQNAKFMANYRQVSKVAQVVKSLTDPRIAAQKYATLELISKMNLALYYGSEKRNALQWNGINNQIVSWVDAFPGDSGILYDAAGKPLTKELFLDIISQCAGQFYGKPTELRCSVNTYKDMQKGLFPEARYTEGKSDGGVYGTDRSRYLTAYGDISLKYDKMLRANRPLVANGPGADGKPRLSTTVDTGSATWTATPFVAASSAIGVQALPQARPATSGRTPTAPWTLARWLRFRPSRPGRAIRATASRLEPTCTPCLRWSTDVNPHRGSTAHRQRNPDGCNGCRGRLDQQHRPIGVRSDADRAGQRLRQPETDVLPRLPRSVYRDGSGTV